MSKQPKAANKSNQNKKQTNKTKKQKKKQTYVLDGIKLRRSYELCNTHTNTHQHMHE